VKTLVSLLNRFCEYGRAPQKSVADTGRRPNVEQAGLSNFSSEVLMTTPAANEHRCRPEYRPRWQLLCLLRHGRLYAA